MRICQAQNNIEAVKYLNVFSDSMFKKCIQGYKDQNDDLLSVLYFLNTCFFIRKPVFCLTLNVLNIMLEIKL